MTNELLLMVLEETEENMKKTIAHFIDTMTKIRAGKASPQMISEVYVDYYGAKTPVHQMANIGTPDAKTILIQPWDKSTIPAIEKAIMAANLGFNPQNDGEIIRIPVPPLTEERRRQLVKFIHQETENNKIAIRNIRKKSMEEVKSLQKDGVPEDEVKKAETKIQDMTNNYIKNIDEITAKKEKEIMTV
ncbi:MAG TPA: ribosome recycling factor [Bacteroidia bacterium]|nr:ribosome recycling factor [Sphingobacteriales bacterium]HPD65478.1 ribosome recycling factor [Bacteroidia bacterium]HRS59133.1 ribosome recycling factor [Bacteroidia bacterium]HRU67429.1 ribosome recycling factor [Bacteroidia bacterium]